MVKQPVTSHYYYSSQNTNNRSHNPSPFSGRVDKDLEHNYKGMEASTHRRPQTAGAPSSTRRGSSNNAFDAEEKHATRTTINTSRPPARPSTQRSGRSPRVENNAARAKQGYSASSSAEASSSPERARLVVEVASLKEKLSESELAKSQAKVYILRIRPSRLFSCYVSSDFSSATHVCAINRNALRRRVELLPQRSRRQLP